MVNSKLGFETVRRRCESWDGHNPLFVFFVKFAVKVRTYR